MEWILWIVLAVMLALLCYSVFRTSFAIGEKVQPTVDQVFEVLHVFLGGRSAGTKDDQSNQKPQG
jgi:hypothetical protein